MLCIGKFLHNLIDRFVGEFAYSFSRSVEDEKGSSGKDFDLFSAYSSHMNLNNLDDLLGPQAA